MVRVMNLALHLIGVWVIGLPLIGCGQSPGGSADSPPPSQQAPTIVWEAPEAESEGVGVGQGLRVQLRVDDPDGSEASAEVWIFSDREGELLSASPADDGVFIGEVTLGVSGDHVLLARVRDAQGLEAEADLRINAIALTPPTVDLSPLDRLPQEGDSIVVNGRCSDLEDEPEVLRAAWEVDGRAVDGGQPSISGAIALELEDLAGGEHTVTVIIKDSHDQSATDSLTFTVTECPDEDRDGYTACPRDPEDCDDGDRSVNPGADEACDEVDHDCDGEFYNDLPDTDRDGVSDCLDPCPADRQDDPDGDGICQSDDNCPREANPDQLDQDGDGLGDVCDLTPGEVCDGLDNDQDGAIDEGFDQDEDGVPSCDRGPFPGDCDDTDPEIYPGVPEVCDGLDNNCNGTADDGFPDADDDTQADCVDPCPFDAADDGDGDGVCADVDNCPDIPNPEQRDGDLDGLGDDCDDETIELCDRLDNDLDGQIDEGLDAQDSDGDGEIDCQDACPFDGDNDSDGDGVCGDVDVCPDISDPGQEDVDGNGVGDACDVEVCDGLDNDGDGAPDEGFDEDGDGVVACGISLPDIGDLPGDCDDADSTTYPGAQEQCDGVDHDCDGSTDEGFEDGDADGIPDCRDLCPEDPDNDLDEDGVCGEVDNCPDVPNDDQGDIDRDGIGDACDPENTEICDGIDNDLDGAIDEDASFQLDDDGDGILNCVDICPSTDLNDPDEDGVCEDVDNCPGLFNPDQIDVDGSGVGDRCEPEYCDGVDNDLDGLIDEDFDADGDGFPTCAVGEVPEDCDDTNPDAFPGPAEVCGDGRDNNCDGVIDLIEDEFEPNDIPAEAHDLGLFDNNSITLYPTFGQFDGEDQADVFQFRVVDDDGPAPDDFFVLAELRDIPPGLELGLSISLGPATIAVSENPGGEDQILLYEGRAGVDDGALIYYVEVTYLGGDRSQACGPYTLVLSNDG